MKKHFHVIIENKPGLLSALNDMCISFKKEMHPFANAEYIVIDTFDERIMRFLSPDDVVVETMVFSDREMNEAEWLTLRCLSAKVKLENEDVSFACTELYDNGAKANHRFLSGNPFFVKTAPKHRATQAFFSAYAASENHIFCTQRAKDVITNSLLKYEIRFESVLSINNDMPVNDLFYMNVNSSIPEIALDVTELDAIKCEFCGRVDYLEPMQLSIIGSNFDCKYDIVKTKDCFCSGGNLTYPILIVSQRFRKLLIDAKLTKGLKFEPVFIKP